MSDELEEAHGDGEVNADAIAEAFSDDHHEDEEELGTHSYLNDEEDEEDDWFDTNSEILDHDNQW